MPATSQFTLAVSSFAVVMRRNANLAKWLLPIAVFLLPWFMRGLLNLPWLMLQNFTDGVFYLGYASQFDELVADIGLHYYAVRFPVIATDAFFLWVTGSPWGFFLWRYLLGGFCCLALYSLFAGRANRLAGVFAALVWAFNPFALRFLQTAYTDVVGASFLCIGLCLLLMPCLRWWAATFGGALLAGACWSHLHAVVAATFAVPMVVAVRWNDGWRRHLVNASAILAGALLISGIAALWYFLRFGLWDLTMPTREILRLIDDGTIDKPLISWWEILRDNCFWLVPIPLLGALLFGARKDKLAWGAWFALSAYVLFLLLNDLWKGGYSLSLFYYFSFAVPVFAICIAAILSRILECRKNFTTAFLLIVCLIAPLLLVAFPDPGSMQTVIYSVAIVAVPAFFLTKKQPMLVLGGYCILACQLLLVLPPAGKVALGHYWKGDDRPVLEMAMQLRDHLREVRRPGEVLRFWYNDEANDLRMVQSLFLHEFTKWKLPDGRALRFPDDPEISQSLVIRGGVRHLVVLGLDEQEVLLGSETLKSRGLSLGRARPKILKFGGQQIHALHFVLPEPDGELVREVNPSWEKHHRAHWKRTPEFTEIGTRPKKWAKDAWMDVGDVEPGQIVELTLRVLHGQILVDLVPGRDEDGSGYAFPISSSPDPWKVFLTVDPEGRDRVVRIRNFGQDGVSSLVHLMSVRVLRPDFSDDISED